VAQSAGLILFAHGARDPEWALPFRDIAARVAAARPDLTLQQIQALHMATHKGARLIRKVVMSAAANALNQNRKLGEDMLYVKELRIDDGPRMRRVWFRARGRADMLVKQMCHISVVVDEVAKAEA